MLRSWEKLPENMKNDQVRPYYEILSRKKASLLLKRIFDYATALVLFVLFLPFYAVIAVAIKADSKGPVFYRQERITQYGKVFRIHKFRSMVTDADKIGTQVTLQNDSRITKVGAFIRKYRLNEISQVIDILQGNMSFVGTRPEVKKYVDCYSDEMMATLLLPAGVTSEASIRYKDEAALLEKSAKADETYTNVILPQKMRYNLDSLRDFSFLADLRTMMRTVLAVFGKRYEA